MTLLTRGASNDVLRLLIIAVSEEVRLQRLFPVGRECGSKLLASDGVKFNLPNTNIITFISQCSNTNMKISRLSNKNSLSNTNANFKIAILTP